MNPTRDSSSAGDLPRRLGQFAVGAFAGACALFAPRLTLLVGQPDSAVSITAMPWPFITAAVFLSLIVGGVAMILEWEGSRSPKDTFMAALGVPALLSGAYTSANVSQETLRLAGETRRLSDSLARSEGIVVEGAPQGSLQPAQGTWPPTLRLMPVAHAATLDPLPASDQKKGASVSYTLPRYFVVFHEDRVREAAVRRASDLGTRFGALNVQPLGDGFIVTLADGALPYPEAVARAVDTKRRSQGTLTPKLVKAP